MLHSFSPLSTSPNSNDSNNSNDSTRVGSAQQATEDPVVIVGISLKLPGDADSVESFWEMMMRGQTTASEFPKDRLNHAAHYSADSSVMGTASFNPN